MMAAIAERLEGRGKDVFLQQTELIYCNVYQGKSHCTQARCSYLQALWLQNKVLIVILLLKKAISQMYLTLEILRLCVLMRVLEQLPYLLTCACRGEEDGAAGSFYGFPASQSNHRQRRRLEQNPAEAEAFL